MDGRLTRAQRDLLSWMATTNIEGIRDESVVKALLRKGLAERIVPTFGAFRGAHQWRITPAGRAALSDGERG